MPARVNRRKCHPLSLTFNLREVLGAQIDARRWDRWEACFMLRTWCSLLWVARTYAFRGDEHPGTSRRLSRQNSNCLLYMYVYATSMLLSDLHRLSAMKTHRAVESSFCLRTLRKLRVQGAVCSANNVSRLLHTTSIQANDATQESHGTCIPAAHGVFNSSPCMTLKAAICRQLRIEGS